jgi:uncharacterized protein (TIGR00730 family)
VAKIERLCVYCGSSGGTREVYAAAARELGGLLAARGIGLVYGGGSVGLMGILADAALGQGGEVIGVIPEELVRREVAHQGLSELRVVMSMHERKALMADLADGFVALPGGYGTWEEFFEMVTWVQLGLHPKPCGLLNVAGYYDPLLQLADHAVAEGFLRATDRQLIVAEAEPAALLERIEQMEPPPLPKWLSREDT